MITFLKILLTIILIPLKVVFFVLAYVFYLVMYILHFLFTALSMLWEVIGTFILYLFGFGSIVVTIIAIVQMKSGSLTVTEGVVLIVFGWVMTIISLPIYAFLEFVSEGVLDLGEIVTDFAKANWFEFW